MFFMLQPRYHSEKVHHIILHNTTLNSYKNEFHNGIREPLVFANGKTPLFQF